MVIAPAFVCPVCRGGLEDRSGRFVCTSDGDVYVTRSGIPILVAPAVGEGFSAAGHKAQQIAYFDQEPDDDFGVTRPRGAPALYEHLLRDKFRRSIQGLEAIIPGATILVVCGGSGLDAEFLVEAGARVIVSDISFGVLQQAQERSRRFGLGFELVVADVEALPFADRSIDVVYVHDGLHHLERPEAGLAEMARVARRALSVSEPARSLASNVAVRLRVSTKQEEAGNPVARLDLDEVVQAVRSHGFRPLHAHRYAMFYRHWPGPAMRALSSPALAPVARGLYTLANRAAGRLGNKLTVQAVRAEAPTSDQVIGDARALENPPDTATV
jgi:SAM-dependent methyltransferase